MISIVGENERYHRHTYSWLPCWCLLLICTQQAQKVWIWPLTWISWGCAAHTGWNSVFASNRSKMFFATRFHTKSMQRRDETGATQNLRQRRTFALNGRTQQTPKLTKKQKLSAFSNHNNNLAEDGLIWRQPNFWTRWTSQQPNLVNRWAAVRNSIITSDPFGQPGACEVDVPLMKIDAPLELTLDVFHLSVTGEKAAARLYQIARYYPQSWVAEIWTGTQLHCARLSVPIKSRRRAFLQENHRHIATSGSWKE